MSLEIIIFLIASKSLQTLLDSVSLAGFHKTLLSLYHFMNFLRQNTFSISCSPTISNHSETQTMMPKPAKNLTFVRAG